MAGEEKGAQGQIPEGSGNQATEGSGVAQEGAEALPEAVAARLGAVEQALEKERARSHAMESRLDKDIARERSRADQRTKSLQAYVREKMEKAGASSEELATFESEFGSEAERLSDKEMADRYREMVANQGVEAQIKEHQEGFIKRIGSVVGVEIDPNHPDLKRSFENSPEEFENSVEALAKRLAEEKGKAEGQESLTEAAKKGALGSLGGGTGTAANPLAGITDPDKLHDIWVEKGRPMPTREEA